MSCILFTGYNTSCITTTIPKNKRRMKSILKILSNKDILQRELLEVRNQLSKYEKM